MIPRIALTRPNAIVGHSSLTTRAQTRFTIYASFVDPTDPFSLRLFWPTSDPVGYRTSRETVGCRCRRKTALAARRWPSYVSPVRGTARRDDRRSLRGRTSHARTVSPVPPYRVPLPGAQVKRRARAPRRSSRDETPTITRLMHCRRTRGAIRGGPRSPARAPAAPRGPGGGLRGEGARTVYL